MIYRINRKIIKTYEKTLKAVFSMRARNKSFVTFSKIGLVRLGNQLFRYAALKSYSLRNKVPIILPPDTEHRLNNFKIEYLSKPLYWLNYSSDSNYVEKKFNFDSNFFSFHNRTEINGFFQTEKYFKDIRQILQTDLKLANCKKEKKAIENIKLIKQEFPGKKIVSIHVRRGDYIPSSKPYSDGITDYSPDRHLKHPLMTVDYFQSAAARFQNAVFLIFSDTNQDIEWCKENLNIKNAVYIHNEDLIDFKMMQFSDHNIISNSSFSWWAAWLNDNDRKQIISPKKGSWFGEFYSHYNMNDLIPEDWEQI